MEVHIAKVTACYLAHQWNGNGAVRWLATLSTLIVGRHDHESVSSRQIRPGVTTDPAHAPSCQGRDPAMIQVLRDQASPRRGRCRETLGFHHLGVAWGRPFLVLTLHVSNRSENVVDHEGYLRQRDHYLHATCA